MGLVEKIKEVTPFKRYFNFTEKKLTKQLKQLKQIKELKQ
jgi:hypothetical protein